MIDNPVTTVDLMAKLEAALPMPTRLTPELQASLSRQKIVAVVLPTATITLLHYTGDEGGILCKLDLGPDMENAAYVSITHLRFDPRLPLAREINAY